VNKARALSNPGSNDNPKVTSRRYQQPPFVGSEDAVSRHVKSGHVGQLLALTADAERAVAADNLLDRIEALQSRTLAILEAAEWTKDHRTALSAIREARANLEMVGEITKELDRGGTVNLEFLAEVGDGRA
jgi:hypothetical protein